MQVLDRLVTGLGDSEVAELIRQMRPIARYSQAEEWGKTKQAIDAVRKAVSCKLIQALSDGEVVALWSAAFGVNLDLHDAPLTEGYTKVFTDPVMILLAERMQEVLKAEHRGAFDRLLSCWRNHQHVGIPCVHGVLREFAEAVFSRN